MTFRDGGGSQDKWLLISDQWLVICDKWCLWWLSVWKSESFRDGGGSHDKRLQGGCRNFSLPGQGFDADAEYYWCWCWRNWQSWCWMQIFTHWDEHFLRKKNQFCPGRGFPHNGLNNEGPRGLLRCSQQCGGFTNDHQELPILQREIKSWVWTKMLYFYLSTILYFIQLCKIQDIK